MPQVTFEHTTPLQLDCHDFREFFDLRTLYLRKDLGWIVDL